MSERNLVNMIVEETFRKIEQFNEFKGKTIVRLKDLARSGNLTSQQIIDAIKLNSGEQNETP